MLSSLAGMGLFGYIVYFAMTHTAEEKFTGFYNHTALLLLLVSPFAIVLMSRSFVDFYEAIRAIFTMSFLNIHKEMKKTATILTALSQDIRVNGVGTLVKRKAEVKNQFFKEGITLILNSFTTEEIKHNMMAKINVEQARLSQAVSLFEAMGKVSPAMGLLGTLVGLVQMLANLSDPSKIGPGMAVSLLATLYGLILGNAIYLPIADKIETHMERKLQLDTMIMEGVLLLKEKKSGAHISGMVGSYGAEKNTANENVAELSQPPRSHLNGAPTAR